LTLTLTFTFIPLCHIIPGVAYIGGRRSTCIALALHRSAAQRESTSVSQLLEEVIASAVETASTVDHEHQSSGQSIFITASPIASTNVAKVTRAQFRIAAGVKVMLFNLIFIAILLL